MNRIKYGVTLVVVLLSLSSCFKKNCGSYLIEDASTSEVIREVSNSRYNLKVTHHIDKPEANFNNSYEYYYEYYTYEFTDSKSIYVARSYLGSEEEASFGSLTEADLGSELFLEAVQYLESNGAKNIQFLTSAGYETIKKKQNE